MSMNDDAIDAVKTPDANMKVLARLAELHHLALGAIDNLKLTTKKMFINANQAGQPGAEGGGTYTSSIDRRVKSVVRGRPPGIVINTRAP